MGSASYHTYYMTYCKPVGSVCPLVVLLLQWGSLLRGKKGWEEEAAQDYLALFSKGISRLGLFMGGKLGMESLWFNGRVGVLKQPQKQTQTFTFTFSLHAFRLHYTCGIWGCVKTFWLWLWNRDPEGNIGKIKDSFKRMKKSRQPGFPRGESWCRALVVCSSSESATADGQRE